VASTEETFQQLVAELDYPMFIEVEEREGQLRFHRARRIEPGHDA